MGYLPWGCKELNTNEVTEHTHAHTPWGPCFANWNLTVERGTSRATLGGQRSANSTATIQRDDNSIIITPGAVHFITDRK